MKRGSKNLKQPDPEELEEMEEETERKGPIEALLALGFPSDRLYLVTATENYYAFTYVGNELHMKEQLFPERRLRDADRARAGKKDIWIPKNEIQDFHLRMKHCASTNIPNNAALKLRTNAGKRYSLILCMEEEREAYLEFFRDVAKRRDPESSEEDRYAEAREIEKENRRLKREKLEEKQERELEKRQTKSGNRLAMFAEIGILVLEIALFICYKLLIRRARILGILVCYGLLALTLFLVWRFPTYFSLRDSKTQRYESRASLLGPTVIPLLILGLLSMDREHYDSIPRLILIWAATGAVVTFLVWWFTRRQELSRGDLLTILIVFFVVGGGSIAMSANLLLAPSNPDEMKSAEIVKLWADEGSRSTNYRATLLLEGEEHDYDLTKICYESVQSGGSVSVGLWKGGLGIPYSLVLEPGEDPGS